MDEGTGLVFLWCAGCWLLCWVCSVRACVGDVSIHAPPVPHCLCSIESNVRPTHTKNHIAGSVFTFLPVLMKGSDSSSSKNYISSKHSLPSA